MLNPTDTEIHDALVAYTGDAPPPSFTYEQVLSGGRRIRQRRRVAMAAAATVLAAVTVGAASLAPPDQPPPYGVAGPSWSTLDARSYCRTANAPAAASDDRAAAQLSCYLATAVPKVLPGVTYYQSAATPAGTKPLQAYPGRDTPPPYITDQAVTAAAVIADDQGVAIIGFGAVLASESTEHYCIVKACGGGYTCPDGGSVLTQYTTAPSGYRLTEVYRYAGDEMISARISNATAFPTTAGQSDSDIQPTRPSVPLETQQLADLVCGADLELAAHIR